MEQIVVYRTLEADDHNRSDQQRHREIEIPTQYPVATGYGRHAQFFLWADGTPDAFCIHSGHRKLTGTSIPFARPRESYLKSAPMPFYSPLARQARISGTIHLLFTVDGQGNTSAVEASTANELLRRTAIENVQNWKFGWPHPCDCRSREGGNFCLQVFRKVGIARATKRNCPMVRQDKGGPGRDRGRSHRTFGLVSARPDQKEKANLISQTGLYLMPATTYAPTHLARAVPSALRGLTSVFGMGTGGSPAVRLPTSRGVQKA